MNRKKPRLDIILKDIESEGYSLSQRSLIYNGGSIEILYIQQLTDRVSLMDFVIKPLSLFLNHAQNTNLDLNAETVALNVLQVDDLNLQSNQSDISSLILDGKSIDASIAADSGGCCGRHLFFGQHQRYF